jgi:hypothetical protein
MKDSSSNRIVCAMALLSGFALSSQAQTVIFSENFDPLSSAGFVQYGYQFGDATSHTVAVTSGIGVGGTAALQVQLVAAAGGVNGYAGVAGQYQNQTISGNTSLDPSDYILSFDAAANGGSLAIQVQTWDGQHFGGSYNGTIGTSADLALTSTFQHYSLNLGSLSGSLTGLGVAGGTYQLNIQLDGGGATPYTDTLALDNLQLIMVPEPSSIALLGLGALAFTLHRRKSA